MLYFELPLLVVFACAAFLCRMLAAPKAGLSFVRAGDLRAVQAAHSTPASRLGGVAIACAMLISLGFVTGQVRSDLTIVIAAALPILCAGLSEDLGFALSPRQRLRAAALSSMLGVLGLHMWVTGIDTLGLDLLFGLLPVAITFTVFACAGICNAFNLIDGLNGLAPGAAVLTALGLATVSHLAGLPDLAIVCWYLIAALMGFLVLNFPWGRIFLGDAGAYLTGHVLAWLSVILMFRAPDVTPWAIVLIFFWPLVDTLFAIYRRRMAGRAANQPDRMHFHHVVLRALEIMVLGRKQRHIANPVTTLILLPLMTAPVVTGIFLWNAPALACVAFAGYAGAFIVSYHVTVHIARRHGKSGAWPRTSPIHAGWKRAVKASGDG